MTEYKKKVYALFYSEKEDDGEASAQIRNLCLELGDRFEGIVKVASIKD